MQRRNNSIQVKPSFRHLRHFCTLKPEDRLHESGPDRRAAAPGESESHMPKAILRNGHIHPLEPLPAEWREGQELDVEPSQLQPNTEPSPAEIDRDFQELDALCALGDPVEDERLALLLEEAHRQ